LSQSSIPLRDELRLPRFAGRSSSVARCSSPSEGRSRGWWAGAPPTSPAVGAARSVLDRLAEQEHDRGARMLLSAPKPVALAGRSTPVDAVAGSRSITLGVVVQSVALAQQAAVWSRPARTPASTSRRGVPHRHGLIVVVCRRAVLRASALPCRGGTAVLQFEFLDRSGPFDWGEPAPERSETRMRAFTSDCPSVCFPARDPRRLTRTDRYRAFEASLLSPVDWSARARDNPTSTFVSSRGRGTNGASAAGRFFG
jgi:hypothetical protein